MITHEFLRNAKLFSNGIDTDRIWLVDCDKKLAVVCSMKMFLSQDFIDLEDPTAEKYADFLELIRREIMFLGVDANKNLYYVRSEPQTVTFVNQAAIQQILYIANRQLAALIEVNEEKYDYSASSTSSVPREELIDLAIAYAKRMIAKVSKEGGHS